MKSTKEVLEKYKNNTDHYADQEYSEDSIIEAMKEFAMQYVKAALFEASKASMILEESGWGKWENTTQKPEISTNHKVIKKNEYGYGECTYQIITVDKNSILSAYSLDKIQ